MKQQTEKKSKFKLKLQQCEETQEEIERIEESEQKKTNNNQRENSVQVQCCVVLCCEQCFHFLHSHIPEERF